MTHFATRCALFSFWMFATLFGVWLISTGQELFHYHAEIYPRLLFALIARNTILPGDIRVEGTLFILLGIGIIILSVWRGRRDLIRPLPDKGALRAKTPIGRLCTIPIFLYGILFSSLMLVCFAGIIVTDLRAFLPTRQGIAKIISVERSADLGQVDSKPKGSGRRVGRYVYYGPNRERIEVFGTLPKRYDRRHPRRGDAFYVTYKASNLAEHDFTRRPSAFSFVKHTGYASFFLWMFVAGFAGLRVNFFKSPSSPSDQSKETLNPNSKIAGSERKGRTGQNVNMTGFGRRTFS